MKPDLYPNSFYAATIKSGLRLCGKLPVGRQEPRACFRPKDLPPSLSHRGVWEGPLKQYSSLTRRVRPALSLYVATRLGTPKTQSQPAFSLRFRSKTDAAFLQSVAPQPIEADHPWVPGSSFGRTGLQYRMCRAARPGRHRPLPHYTRLFPAHCLPTCP